MWPSFQSLLSKAAPVEYQGTVQGISSSVGSLASIVGLIVGGIGYGLLKNETFVLSGSIVFGGLRFCRCDCSEWRNRTGRAGARVGS